ncbi:hypothetical protein [Streptomyces europaeiscabiei]|uniref:hypothetical protein n=1 Tax=Streptomyces europaeiscabiei TaxID=146819 RepID=UPI000765F78A|nr:hypothetical protein [Streptomyces europaeiscabiei]MDX2529034.1 hypothetical protein [Streptomyces europaeiscabiei]
MPAASLVVHGDRHPLPAVGPADEILALWDRPQITRTVLEGHFGPLVRTTALPGGRTRRPGVTGLG